MPHPYSTWLAPGTQVFGSDPDSSAYSSEGTIPHDIYVLAKHPYPERGESYVQAKVDEMRRILGPDHVIRISETIFAGSVQLYEGSLIYIASEHARSKIRVYAPELQQPPVMEHLL